jgi:hypothetical protein
LNTTEKTPDIHPSPSVMVKINIYGRGRPLRMAIMFTCQLAFILFGKLSAGLQLGVMIAGDKSVVMNLRYN